MLNDDSITKSRRAGPGESSEPPVRSEAQDAPLTPPRTSGQIPLMLYGLLLLTLGLAMYLFGVAMGVVRVALGLNAQLYELNQWIVWNSGIPIAVGVLLVLVDLLVFYDRKRVSEALQVRPIARPRVTVALTAYNDEDSIGPAVLDFVAHPLVERVIVVSNNSSDRTFERAEAAGAIAVNEPLPGYGRCVHRCLSEAAAHDDTDLVVLCEGDRTFRAYDIDKLVAYAPHADIVNGTRTVESLREHRTQLSTFMYWGNFFVGKLLEAKHLGRGTITDVGTTYKLVRRDRLPALLARVNPAINLEFNAHFLDTAIGMGARLVEVPITFHPRVGVSKGGNTDDWRGFTVGLKMIGGITFGWRRRAA